MFAAGVTLTLLVRWNQLTPTLGVVLFGLWVVKDLVMFPVTRIAYETGNAHHGKEAMVGATGVAQGPIAPDATGYVKVGAELWRARSTEGLAIQAGDAVRVVEVHDLTLHVEPAPADAM
jgi:membrane protein implicated in regulation of membrane protease activity